MSLTGLVTEHHSAVVKARLIFSCYALKDRPDSDRCCKERFDFSWSRLLYVKIDSSTGMDND